MQLNSTIFMPLENFHQIINDNREMSLWTYKFAVCPYFVCLARAARNCICMYIHFINFISKIIVFEFCFFEQYFGLVYPLILIGREQGQ